MLGRYIKMNTGLTKLFLQDNLKYGMGTWENLKTNFSAFRKLVKNLDY